MNCRHVQNNLSAYLDQELTIEEMADIRTHLYDCSACREEEAELRSLKALLTGMKSKTPNADFEERLVNSTIQKGMAEARAWPRRAGIFLVVAVCSMLGTMQLLQSMKSRQDEITAKTERSHEIASAIHRDQVFTASLDPYNSGSIVLPTDGSDH